MNYLGVFPDKVVFEQSYIRDDAMSEVYGPRDAMSEVYGPRDAMSQVYGPRDAMSEVYGPRDAMTADTINFVRVKKLWGEKEEYSAPMKSGLILDGGGRTRYAHGGMDYGTFIYPRNGNKDTLYRLYKHPSGGCYYDELIYQDDEWKILLSYKFNESSLNWRELGDQNIYNAFLIHIQLNISYENIIKQY